YKLHTGPARFPRRLRPVASMLTMYQMRFIYATYVSLGTKGHEKLYIWPEKRCLVGSPNPRYLEAPGHSISGPSPTRSHEKCYEYSHRRAKRRKSCAIRIMWTRRS